MDHQLEGRGGETKMPILALPQLVAGRDFADEVIDKLGPLAGTDVLIDARELVSGTPSFAAQIVERVLGTDGAASLTIVGAPQEFIGYARRAADKINVTDRFKAETGDVSRTAAG
jgi:hypothetical protein